MSAELFSKLLSQNYIELLEDNEYYDVTIEVAHIKLPNISPEIFQIILRYIYGGILLLNGQETLNILNTLNIKDAILSNVRDAWRALDYSRSCGPQFGQDLNIISRNTKSFNVTYCKKVMYERNIRDTEDEFSIEDYEVFQIIRS
ncbi:BTB/POZ protein [Rhizophagus irregularis DAOM 181602=DAOM 197198]|nr:BTB/POZ protein [Rhizophagus irregularis DAOM 181602=DAOM 197198]